MASFEKKFKSFSKDVQKIKGVNDKGQVYSFVEGLEIVRSALAELLKNQEIRKDEQEKTKEALRKRKEEVSSEISPVIFSNSIKVREYDTTAFIEACVEEFVGYSVLAPLFKDLSISDIFCNRWNSIYVERNGENVKTDISFRDEKHFNDFIDRVLKDGGSGIGKVINSGENKIVDAEFYGDRVQATHTSVSPKGRSITFRKHAESHIKLDQIIAQETMNQELADFLGTTILGELNLVYAGITGSGKTTSIRALLDHYVALSNKRALVVEDTQELNLENDHTLELVSSKNSNPKLAVTLEDLIITALRLKPKYIVVGEVRGVEAQAAVEAMETGHSTIFTMHGGEPINIVNRLVTKYLQAMPTLGIDVVERIIGSSVDYIAIQDDIPDIGRRVSIISEVTYDFESQRVSLKPIFEFDFDTESYKMVNKISPDKAKRMMRRGIKKHQLEKWVEGWDNKERVKSA
ncbi:CpaF family protein [Rossellomorea marisflavi]|uniref:CpaF family protein n=1 Tax=Rossellomorea marisflavi TaxID=189381 RepID=UPI003FA0F54D